MGSRFKKERAGKKPIAPKEENQFEFPTNVKQIGSMNKGMKIYIEDYAHTYLNRLGEKGADQNSAAFLIGYYTQELGEDILVISGAVEPPLSFTSKNGEVFSKEDRQYCQEIIEKYFEGLEIVGWARIQPGYGVYLSASDVSNHYLGFTEPKDVLFLCDSEAKEDCFFAWNQKQDDLEEISGYFIFYDKNHGMNQFMADSRKGIAVKSPIERLKALRGEGAETEGLEDDLDLEAGEAESAAAGEEEEAIGGSKADELSRINEERAKRISDITRQKRIIKMMTSVSALLFLACAIMGIGLLQSGERIAKIEDQMTEIRRGYNNIVSKMNDNAYPAFAAQIPEEGDGAAAADGVADRVVADEINRVMADSQAQQEPAAPQAGTDALDQALGIETVKDIVSSGSPEAAAQSNQESPGISVNESARADSDVSKESDTQDEDKPKDVTYVIQRGDTLSAISTKFYGTINNIETIMEANGITDPARLKVGKKITIPDVE